MGELWGGGHTHRQTDRKTHTHINNMTRPGLAEWKSGHFKWIAQCCSISAGQWCQLKYFNKILSNVQVGALCDNYWYSQLHSQILVWIFVFILVLICFVKLNYFLLLKKWESNTFVFVFVNIFQSIILIFIFGKNV